MNSRRKILAVLLLVVMAVSLLSVCALAADDGDDVAKSITCTTCNGTGISQGEECSACEGTGEITSTSRMAFSFWALVPPIVAIILALITKEVYSSLFVGILLGALFYSNFNPITGLDAIINDGMVPAVADSAGIMLFLVILGAMVALINRAGGSAAFGRWAETHIKTRAGAMFATFLLGVLIFVDDYFNCLTVGSVMLPVTDRHKVSRAKLAYLIDATAAPVCMIAPISSWAAAVSGVVEDYNGFDLFVRAIPYNFYSLLTFVFIIALILMKFDYGPMRLHEMNARFKNDLYTTGDRADGDNDAIDCNQNGRVIDLILPVAVLIVTCFAGLVYAGGYWDASGDYYHDFVGAFGNTDAFVALPWGSLIALVFTIIYFLCRRLITFKDSMACLPKGFINMVPAIMILTFATSLKNMTGLLGGKYFVASVMNSAAGSLFSFLPAIIFLVAGVLSFSTGTSWGTFGSCCRSSPMCSTRRAACSSSACPRAWPAPCSATTARPFPTRPSWPPPVRCATTSTTCPRSCRMPAPSVSSALSTTSWRALSRTFISASPSVWCSWSRPCSSSAPSPPRSRCPASRTSPERAKPHRNPYVQRRLRAFGGGVLRLFAAAQKGLTFDRECGIVNLPVSREVPFLCPFGSYREAITSRQGRNQ